MSTIISLPIEPPINTSLSVGDTVFYVSGSNGPTTEARSRSIYRL